MPNYESMLSLTKQGINIFNSSDEFYNDLCYDYELNGTKDVAYKDRLKVFYPNISLCDSGCKQIGVFLENMTAHFECDFKDLSNNNFNSIKDNVIFDELLGDYLSFFESSNLKVLKCAKKGIKYFTKFYGMYITLSSLGVSCILIASFYMIELSSLKVYIFKNTQKYLDFISANPPRKNKNQEDDGGCQSYFPQRVKLFSTRVKLFSTKGKVIFHSQYIAFNQRKNIFL